MLYVAMIIGRPSPSQIVGMLACLFALWVLVYYGIEMAFFPAKYRDRLARYSDARPSLCRYYEYVWPNWKQSAGYLLVARVQGVFALLTAAVLLVALARESLCH